MELIELLVWGVAVGAAMVFQYLHKRRQERERAQQPPASQLPEGLFQPPEAPPPVPALEDTHWGRSAPAHELPAPIAPLPPAGQHLPVPLAALHATVPHAATPAPVRSAWHPAGRTRRAFFRNRADVQHAVIGMTILGPCRALEPYVAERFSGGARTPPAQGSPGR